MFLTSGKQKEITELLTENGKWHVSSQYDYAIKFFDEGENAHIRFTILQNGKEILQIVNIMTPGGFRDLNERKAWTTWAVELCAVMKGCLNTRVAKLTRFQKFKKSLNNLLYRDLTRK